LQWLSSATKYESHLHYQALRDVVSCMRKPIKNIYEKPNLNIQFILEYFGEVSYLKR